MGTTYYVAVQEYIPRAENLRGHWETLTIWEFGKDYTLAMALREIGTEPDDRNPWPEDDTPTTWVGQHDDPSGSEDAASRTVIVDVKLPPVETIYGDNLAPWGRRMYALLLEHLRGVAARGFKVRLLLWGH